MKRKLLEYAYQSSQELPATTIIGLLDSSVVEINRLQREVDSLTAKLKELTPKEKLPETLGTGKVPKKK